jgi:predicted porin
MKKLLIASAALAMVAGTAQAQSSVTIYGAVGASSNSVKTNGVTAATAFQGTSDDYLGTTALGFKGTEDLGGGNKAFFTLEGDLSMAGALGSSTGTNQIFNRQAHVGLESAFGTLTVGRQNDSVKDVEGLAQVYNLSDNLHWNTLVGNRYAQIYKYATPTWNGLKASYSYSNGPDNTTTATADGQETLNSYNVSYTYQNLNFAAAKGKISKAVPLTADKETTLLGARATFGNFTVGVGYNANKQGADKLDQTVVSVNYTMGNVDLKAHYVNNDQTGAAMAGSSNTPANYDGNGYGVMGVYNFSKRTAAYVGYADFSATDSTKDQKVTTVGLFHKF